MTERNIREYAKEHGVVVRPVTGWEMESIMTEMETAKNCLARVRACLGEMGSDDPGQNSVIASSAGRLVRLIAEVDKVQTTIGDLDDPLVIDWDLEAEEEEE